MSISTSRRIMARLRLSLAMQERLTAERLTNANAVGLSMQEETLTEMMLLTLALDRAVSGVADAIPFSRSEEGRNGADWLWIFEGHTGERTLLLTQAKKLQARGTYSVHQKAAKSQRSEYSTQREVLLAAGTKYGVRTAYAFYNPTDAVAGIMRSCTWEDMLGPLGGVSLADAHAVHATVGPSGGPILAKDAQDIAWPLSCALLCWRHEQEERALLPDAPDVADLALPLDQVVQASLDASGITRQTTLGVETDTTLQTIASNLREIRSRSRGHDRQVIVDDLLDAAQLGGASLIIERRE